MLKGTYTYIRAERNQGTSKPEKGSKPYDFCNVTLSDDIESFQIDLDTNTYLNSINEGLKKGDKIDIEVEVGTRFKNTSFTITSLKKVNAFNKVG